MAKKIKTAPITEEIPAGPMATAIEQGAVIPDAQVENPATEPDAQEAPAQSEVEKAYGEERLGELLAKPDEFMVADLEPAVREAILRKLGKSVGSKSRIRLSSAESPVKLVWRIASEMKQANTAVTRKEVVEACVLRGVATATAKTQYQHWKRAGEAPRFDPTANKAG